MVQVVQDLVGIEPLDYQVFEVDASSLGSAEGTNSSSLGFDAVATWSKTVSNLETGKEFYVRVSAEGDGIGYGEPVDATSNPVVPRGEPGQVGTVAISRVDAVSVKLEIEQNVEANGAEIEGYTVEWDTSPQFTEALQVTLAPDYSVQAVRLDTWQQGWTSTSAFSLSLFDFGGAFNTRLGGVDINGLPTFVSISEGTNVLSRATGSGFGEASLHKAVPRGGFVSVGGQDFRICLDGELDYDEETLTLCSTSDPYTAQNFVGAATTYDDTLSQVPAYVLDTAIGSAYQLAVGDTELKTYLSAGTNGDVITDNDLTSTLARGDHMRLGHPETGRVFTVCKGDDQFTTTSVPLCSSENPDEVASVMEGDIVSATYEIQEFSLAFDADTGWEDTEVLGYRLTFGDETSATSEAGGHAGCLSFYSTAAEVRAVPPTNRHNIQS